MIITSVERSKNKKGRLSVYIDGEFYLSISEENFIRLSLYEKKEITEEEICDIRDNVIFNEAKSSAMKYLLFKHRSSTEVANKLERDGYDCATTIKVVEELKEMGYLNDVIFAQKFICNSSKTKLQPKKMLKYELLKKGISESVIDQLLDEYEIDETALAEKLVAKKFDKSDIQDKRIKQKIYIFLQNKGFNNGVIDGIINRLI